MDNAPSHVDGLIQRVPIPAAHLAMMARHAVNARRRAMCSVDIRDVRRSALIHARPAPYLNVSRPALIAHAQCLALRPATTFLARGGVKKP
jgi:hypothetical protein